MHDNETVLLEGDLLARVLMQTLPVTLDDQTRALLIGRSLAVNLVGALLPTIEQVSRRNGAPLHALLDEDERGRGVIETVNQHGEITQRLPVDDLLRELLFLRGKLHPAVQTHLLDALTGDEHHAARALTSALRSRPVLAALQHMLKKLMS